MSDDKNKEKEYIFRQLRIPMARIYTHEEIRKEYPQEIVDSIIKGSERIEEIKAFIKDKEEFGTKMVIVLRGRLKSGNLLGKLENTDTSKEIVYGINFNKKSDKKLEDIPIKELTEVLSKYVGVIDNFPSHIKIKRVYEYNNADRRNLKKDIVGLMAQLFRDNGVTVEKTGQNFLLKVGADVLPSLKSGIVKDVGELVRFAEKELGEKSREINDNFAVGMLSIKKPSDVIKFVFKEVEDLRRQSSPDSISK